MESEKQLLDDILSGSRDAMHRLYDRYIGYVMAVGLRYVPDRDEVRDVVQDSFVKIFSSISRFEYRGEGSLKGWMLRIVANEAISYAKAKTKFVFTDVLNMYVFEQKSHKEIAAELGIKESTSASQYLRAKKLLATRIKNYLKNTENEQD